MAPTAARWHRGAMAIDHSSPGSALPPPPAAPGPTGDRPGPAKRKGRPAFGWIILAAIAYSAVREGLEWAFRSWGGAAGAIVAPFLGLAILLGWRAASRRRVRSRGGVEHTPEVVQKQLDDSGLLPPAYAEDGTIAGSSILVVNQMPKVLEVETHYELFGSSAQPLGTVRQIGQSRGKQVARILTTFDQFFTHHFEVEDLEGRDVLRLTRPRKVFKSSLRVFAGDDRYLGTIQQENVFWKIRFMIYDAQHRPVAQLRAQNVRAWDFRVVAGDRELATIVKSWEGWGRTAFTRADRYVLRINEVVPADLRLLLLATPMIIDLGLKQDARGLT